MTVDYDPIMHMLGEMAPERVWEAYDAIGVMMYARDKELWEAGTCNRIIAVMTPMLIDALWYRDTKLPVVREYAEGRITHGKIRRLGGWTEARNKVQVKLADKAMVPDDEPDIADTSAVEWLEDQLQWRRDYLEALEGAGRSGKSRRITRTLSAGLAREMDVLSELEKELASP